MGKLIDMAGERYGRLVVIGRSPNNKGGKVGWVCKCDCGNTIVVQRGHLIDGETKSCGCLRKEISKQKTTRHGETNTRLYNLWCSMKQRCSPYGSEKNVYYGKGIRVCEEWQTYENFRDWALANGYDPNAKRGACTIDRIDGNKNYEPSNCRFISQLENARNTEHTYHFELEGIIKSLPEWCEKYKTNNRLVLERMRRGWEFERALKTPVREGNYRRVHNV